MENKSRDNSQKIASNNSSTLEANDNLSKKKFVPKKKRIDPLSISNHQITQMSKKR